MNGEARTMNGNATSRKAALWVGVVFLLGAALGGLLGGKNSSSGSSPSPVDALGGLFGKKKKQ